MELALELDPFNSFFRGLYGFHLLWRNVSTTRSRSSSPRCRPRRSSLFLAEGCL